MSGGPALVISLSEEAVGRLVEAAAERAVELVLARLGEPGARQPESPYLTIAEAAALLRCKRQRVDDLLSQRRLTRLKDGRRTLLFRAEIERYLAETLVPARRPLHFVKH